jgi:hypothetical protein
MARPACILAGGADCCKCEPRSPHTPHADPRKATGTPPGLQGDLFLPCVAQQAQVRPSAVEVRLL